MQFRCSTVSSGQVVCFVIHGLLRCSCTRSSASLDQTITRTDAYIHGCMCACSFAVDHARMHAAQCMQADDGFVSCVRCDIPRISLSRRYFTVRAVITRSVYLEFPELLFLVNCAAVDCSWRDSYDAVKTVCSYRWDMKFYRASAIQESLERLHYPIIAHYQWRWQTDNAEIIIFHRCLMIRTLRYSINFNVSRL